MKIVIVGATGTIGKRVTEFLSEGHEVITVGKTSGQFQVDIADPKSIRALFEKIGKFDALVSTTGDVAFVPLKDLTNDHWEVGIRNKFLGQVNLVQIGKEYINEGGSFTLTSGILSQTFIAAGTSATSINRAVEGFAQAAAAEIGRGIRINVVSPDLLEDSKAAFGSFFPGHYGVIGCRVAQAYMKSVLGIETGRIYKALNNDYVS
ncbi:short chain dehydrogenase [Peredibacter starrii]|uniref:Short chain dehydrogenase n=1 Tax=Peredibacter starrii TaxID=28202 RepID=A0AAX4HTR3_9BACT|nr:short chain dehydrogenase [Peredibacter starrii]WPU66590.1 short chain dehydrogenase [Peredibacter starrii]